MSSESSPVSDRRGCILLAGGGSNRLGKPKQLLRFDGQTLIRRVACFAIDAGCSPVVAVLGSNAERIAPEIQDLGVRIVLNANWQSGMSTSLAAGVSSISSSDPPISHVLIVVCDQLQINVDTLRKLWQHSAAHPRGIVAARYCGVLGVPAIFPRAFFPNLLALQGDKGARVLIQQLKSDVQGVDFSGGAFDIDTMEDAQRAGLL